MQQGWLSNWLVKHDTLQIKAGDWDSIAIILYVYGYNYLRSQCAYDSFPKRIILESSLDNKFMFTYTTQFHILFKASFLFSNLENHIFCLEIYPLTLDIYLLTLESFFMCQEPDLNWLHEDFHKVFASMKWGGVNGTLSLSSTASIEVSLNLEDSLYNLIHLLTPRSLIAIQNCIDFIIIPPSHIKLKISEIKFNIEFGIVSIKKSICELEK
ncbi:hypothetical protein ACJX0J_007605 [Zea mays]